MKQNSLLVLVLIFAVSINNIYSQGVSINNDGAEPDASAILDIKSNQKGMLIPRMTTAEMQAIHQPANGLQVYNTEEGKIYLYVSPAHLWKEVSYGANSLTPAFVCGDDLYDYRDGKSYPTKLYGTQCWMIKNLNIGTKIDASGYNNFQSDNTIIEKYCNNNLESNCDEYGGMYQWNELMDYSTTEGTQGICPDGWHVPTNLEWFTFENLIDPSITSSTYIGLQGNANTTAYLKEQGNTHWLYYQYLMPATNGTGFTALGGGWWYPSYAFYSTLTKEANFWTSTQISSTQVYDRELKFNNNFMHRYNPHPNHALSVRCIKD